MSDLPCGCELIGRAERSNEPEVAAQMREQGEARQANWRCPFGGHEPPANADELPGPAQETLEAVGTLTGVKCLRTCPLYYARLPQVAEACKARRWAERGELRTLYPDPPGVLLEAIDLVDAGISARMADDMARTKSKRGKSDGD